MNELLAQAYGTADSIDMNTGVEKTAEAALLEELEKVAVAEGIVLTEFSDDDIVEIINEAMNGAEETEKVASAEETVSDEDLAGAQEKLAEADFLGRTMAHSFYQELTSIQNGGVEKTAADQEAFENAAVERANEILAAYETVETEKQSAAGVSNEDVDGMVTERAAELLAEAGYDVNAIAAALG